MIPAQAQQMPRQTDLAIDKATGQLEINFWNFLKALFYRTGNESGIPNLVASDLIAAGTTQATALQLDRDWNEIATTAANSGVQLSDLSPGEQQTVVNAGANTLKVYPFVRTPAVHIDALADNAAYSLASGKEQTFKCWTDTHVRSTQLG